MRVLSRMASGAATTLVVAALLALGGLAVMIFSGYKPEVVVSGSMRPLFDRGTLIFVKPTPAAELKKGDIITFQNPLKGPGDLVTHRVYAVKQTKDGPAFRTKGDANQTPDPWLVSIKQDAGLYHYKIPFVGKLSFVVHSKSGYLLLFAFPVLLLGFIALRKVWTTPEPAAVGV